MLLPIPTLHLDVPTHQLRGEYVVTAYCPCAKCCKKTDGITASGVRAGLFTIAAAQHFPFGTVLFIEGLGEYVVEDRGSAIVGNKLDVFMQSHREAIAFGKRKLYVRLVKWGGA